MNPSKWILKQYYTMKIIGLNEEYKVVAQCEEDEQIRENHLHGIDELAKEYEDKYSKLC